MRSEARMVRKGKLKHHDSSEVNAMDAKTSVEASLSIFHDKRYPSMTLRSPSDLGGNTSTLHSPLQ